MKRILCLLMISVSVLTGCASLAVRPCDSVETRDSKYLARFFLGIITLGLFEVGVQQEQTLEAMEGWRFCPRPAPINWPGPPAASGGPNATPSNRQSRTPGLLINTTRWTLDVYFDTDPAASRIAPLVTLRPGERRQVALLTGLHRIIARPVAAGPELETPAGQYERQLQLTPGDRTFRLDFSETEFK